MTVLNSAEWTFYSVWDLFLITAIYNATKCVEAQLPRLDYPHPALQSVAYYTLWALYGYATGLVATGIWVIAHGP